MPEPLWIYLMALLYFTNITTCSAISDTFDLAYGGRKSTLVQLWERTCQGEINTKRQET
jgi:hypothetical protein